MTSLLSAYRGVVCDLDGVVYRGPVAVPYAVEALDGAALPVVYATNNASRPPALVAAHLRELGLDCRDEDVVTSSQAGARELLRLVPRGAAVLAVGGPGVAEALRDSEFRVLLPADLATGSGPQPAAVLQGYGADVRASDLAEAAYAVEGGAIWMATNTDDTLPTDRGIAPGNGTMVAAVARACGEQPTVAGKPAPPLYLLCAERIAVPPQQILAIGDRLDTDIAGAVSAGMDSAMVLTGVDSLASLAAAPPEQRPTFLLGDLRGLHQPYAVPVLAEGWWTCGGERRRLRDSAWERASAGTALEAQRAVVCALHEALDGGAVDPTEVPALLLAAGVAQ